MTSRTIACGFPSLARWTEMAMSALLLGDIHTSVVKLSLSSYFWWAVQIFASMGVTGLTHSVLATRIHAFTKTTLTSHETVLRWGSNILVDQFSWETEIHSLWWFQMGAGFPLPNEWLQPYIPLSMLTKQTDNQAPTLFPPLFVAGSSM